jgi:VanZ family protein
MAFRTDRHPWRRIVPPVAYYGLVYFLSSRSRFPVEAPFSGFDKLVHVGIFGIFGLLLVWALTEPGKRPKRSRMALAFFLGALGGALDEIHQIFVPGRSADVWDAAADMAGAAAGVLWFVFFRARTILARAEDSTRP